MSKLRITVFADPVCTWCWGSVPVIRALAYRYGSQLEISYVMGGMIEDIRNYNNRRLSIGGDIALSNRNIHNHWLEASTVHGMPVCEKGYRIFSQERTSTIPHNLAYLVAKVYAERYASEVTPGVALHFLRRIQEATAVDALVTNSVDTLVDMSATVGMVPERFREIYASDTVKELYADCKALCHSYEVQSFPTYVLDYRGEEMMVRGYSSYEILTNSIDQLSYGAIKPIDDGREALTTLNVLDFMETYGSAYPVEIATAFELPRLTGHTALNVESYQGLTDVLDELLKVGEVAFAPRGNGFIYYKLKSSANVHRVGQYAETVK